MSYSRDQDYHSTADRLLARSLLLEALELRASKPPAQMPRDADHRRWARFWTRERACAAIAVFFDRTGRVPTGPEWRHARVHNIPSQQSMLRLFGTTAAGVLAAGLVPVPKRNGRANMKSVERIVNA